MKLWNKTYQKNFLKQVKKVWYEIGTIEFADFFELGWILGLPYEDRLKVAYRYSRGKGFISIVLRDGKYLLDYNACMEDPSTRFYHLYSNGELRRIV